MDPTEVQKSDRTPAFLNRNPPLGYDTGYEITR